MSQSKNQQMNMLNLFINMNIGLNGRNGVQVVNLIKAIEHESKLSLLELIYSSLIVLDVFVQIKNQNAKRLAVLVKILNIGLFDLNLVLSS